MVSGQTGKIWQIPTGATVIKDTFGTEAAAVPECRRRTQNFPRESEDARSCDFAFCAVGT